MDKALHERWLNEIRALALNTLAPFDTSVYLYGSRARSDWKRLSDVDIAIDPHEPLSPTVVLDLEERLEECQVPLRVDIADLSRSNVDFRGKVMKEAVTWRA
ncbi:MAG: nucleotidyltransferase domain-containing protein [Rhodospirillales bacterium]|jgi:hypothetical protein